MSIAETLIDLETQMWPALALGIVAGQILSRRISAPQARRAVVALALAGGMATAIKGVLVW